MYMQTCTDTYTRTHTCTLVHTSTCTHTHTHKHTHTHTHTTTPTPSPTPTHTHREEYICYVQSTDSDHPRILLCKPQIVSLHSKYEDRISTQCITNPQICLRNPQIDIGILYGMNCMCVSGSTRCAISIGPWPASTAFA